MVALQCTRMQGSLPERRPTSAAITSAYMYTLCEAPLHIHVREACAKHKQGALTLHWIGLQPWCCSAVEVTNPAYIS